MLASGLYCARVVVRAHPVHGGVCGDSAHDGEDRDRGPGSADSAPAGDLDSFRCCSGVRFSECVHGVLGGVGQQEVPPSDPAVGPFCDVRVAAQQVDGEVGGGCPPPWSAGSRAADETPVREADHPGLRAPTIHMSMLVRLAHRARGRVKPTRGWRQARDEGGCCALVPQRWRRAAIQF